MKVTRRTLLAGAAGAVVASTRARAQSPQVPADPTKVRGRARDRRRRALAVRAAEAPVARDRAPARLTPHQDLDWARSRRPICISSVTTAACPSIDPETYSLLDPRHGRSAAGLHARRSEALSAGRASASSSARATSAAHARRPRLTPQQLAASRARANGPA